MEYEIIETKKKFNRSDIAVEYYADSFEPEINLDYKTPVCKNVFVKFYLTEGSFPDGITNIFGCNGKVIVLLKEELEKIYTTGENGYVLSDNFEQLIYECDADSELDEKINEIGTND